jgi:hypothetical protein
LHSSSLIVTVHQITINQTYEGSGQTGKRIETRHKEKMDGTITNNVTTTYYLRSRVLGGVRLRSDFGVCEII